MNQNNQSQFEDVISLEVEQKLRDELNVSIKEFRALKKKFKKLQKRDDKVFMDMLRTTSRNHYQMNQMVDRKSRNMIYLNTVMLSLIIGILISSLSFEKVYDFPLIIFSAFSIASIVLAILAMSPEKTHGKLTHEDVRKKQGNPLFFGNFKNLALSDYETAMMEMLNDRDFVYRSMIQDIYHLGLVLESKRSQLRTSQYLFTVGLFLLLLTTFLIDMIKF